MPLGYFAPLEPPAGTTTSMLQFYNLIAELTQDSLTALAGGGQTGATQLTGEICRVATVATLGDSVLLPGAKQGLSIFVLNDGANAMNVFPATSDSIDGAAANASVSQMPSSVVLYFCATAGKWRSEGLATGFAASGLQTMSFKSGITALAGGGQSSSTTKLTSMINRVTTVATQGDSVALPPAVAGLAIMVINKGANPMQVFGDNGAADTINGIATGTGISQGINTNVVYVCTVAGNWEVPLTALWSSTPQAIGAAAFTMPAHVSHTYVLNRAGVTTITLGAPTASTDDGIEIQITSDSAQLHVLNATGILDTGTASVNTATWAAQKGASLNLMAFNARWKVLASNAITFS